MVVRERVAPGVERLASHKISGKIYGAEIFLTT
jgi:hypothetical protein